MVCTKISPFVRGNISTNSVKKISRYISLSISQPELHPFTEKVQPSNRFYYYSDSNIKVKSCEEPPSPQPCPFFLQGTGQRLFLDLTDGLASMHSTLYTEKCALNRETILLLLRILFQFQHVFIKVRHKQSVLNNTILFKFSLCFSLGNLCRDLS